MAKYQSIFDKVSKAKSLNNWEPSLPPGRHKVALVKYGGKTSAKDNSVFLEAEFVILETNNEAVEVGARHSWPWFINKADEFGYTERRAKDFLVVLQKCISNKEDVGEFGSALAEDFEGADPQGYGITLDVAVSAVTDASGAQRRGKKGNEIFNASWFPILQSEDDIAKTKSSIMTTRAPLKAASGR